MLGRRANQETSVNFHAKAVLAFIAFHATVTGEGLLFEGTPATTWFTFPPSLATKA